MARGGQPPVDRFWRYARVLAAVGLVASAALVAATFPPSPVIAPAWLRAPLFISLFPLHLGAILTLRKLGVRKPGYALRTLPPGGRAALGVFCAAMWLTFMVTLFTSSGELPERHGNRYYSSDDIQLTRITEDEYRDLQATDQRRFYAIPAVFYAFGTAVGVTVPRLRDAQQPPPTPSPGNAYLDADL